MTLATVYNVLCTLCEHGLIIEIKTDSNHIRYDADVSMHGHFSCDRCGKIYDFQIKSLDYAGLDGFKTRQRDVYFAGVCNKCNNKKGEKENG